MFDEIDKFTIPSITGNPQTVGELRTAPYKMQTIADIVPTTKKLQDFYDLLKDVADNLSQADELAPEDDYFVMELARVVEFCNGTFPITICTLCGNTDDWHYNNNAECS
jgi:hypothetical protein